MEGAVGDGAVEGYNAQFTWTAFFCCLTAASGGALFGYDNGTSSSQLARKAGCLWQWARWQSLVLISCNLPRVAACRGSQQSPISLGTTLLYQGCDFPRCCLLLSLHGTRLHLNCMAPNLQALSYGVLLTSVSACFLHISLGFAGVMGGVTSMNGFLNNYFPSVLEKQNTVNTVGNLYCQYDSQTLQLMTSVLFISGAICELTGTTGTMVFLTS